MTRGRGPDKKPRKRRPHGYVEKRVTIKAPPFIVPPEIKNVKQRAFLVAFARLDNVAGAAHAAGVSRRSHTNWVREEPYASAFKDAKEAADDFLQALARHRATLGSDTMLIFVMKAAMPEKYREQIAVMGKDGGPIRGSYRLTWGSEDPEPEKPA